MNCPKCDSEQVEITKATVKRDYNLYILAWVIITGFFSLTGLLIFKPLGVEVTQALFMLFGALVGGFGQVIAYFFGSSSGSKDKTQMIASMQMPKK